MTLICGHVAIYVHDLRAAEEFYRRAFGMGLLFRETRREGDDWYALRPHVDWDGAEARGIQIGMVALRRDDVGFRWNVHANEVRFRSSGDIAGRWLD